MHDLLCQNLFVRELQLCMQAHGSVFYRMR